MSAFTSADIPKILALAPDLVLAFSDMQAGIVADLARVGVAVHLFNQRDVAGILAMIRTVGALVDARDRAEALARGYEKRLSTVAERAQGRPRPRVYFEEWDEPLISGIGWVSELVRIAGGDDVFPELAGSRPPRTASSRRRRCWPPGRKSSWHRGAGRRWWHPASRRGPAGRPCRRSRRDGSSR